MLVLLPVNKPPQKLPKNGCQVLLHDVIEGDVVETGYHSLVRKLQANIEQVKQSLAPRLMKHKRESDEYNTDEIPAKQRAAV